MRGFGRLFERGGKAEPPVPVHAETRTEDEPSVIGLRVVRARKRRGWTQEQLAEALDRTDRWVRLLEAGELTWIRRIEDGCSPAPHDLRLLTLVAGVLELDLAELMRAPDVVAPATLAAAAVDGGARQMDSHASVPAQERPAVLAPGRPLPGPRRDPARLGPTRLRTLDAMASPLVLIGAATLAVGVVAASAAAGVLPTSSHRPASATAAGGPRLALHQTETPTLVPTDPVVPETGPLSPPRMGPAPVAPAPQPGPPSVTALPPAAPAAARLPAAVAAAPATRTQRPVGAAATLSTTVVDFGAVRAGSVASRTVTLTNTGTKPIHIGVPVVLMATDLTTATDCTGRTLAPGQRCSITVTFAPGGPVTLNATVMLTDDTPRGREDLNVRGISQ